MIKRLIIAIILLAVLVGGLVGFNMFRDRAIENFFANMPVAPATVSTVTVEPQTWTPAIDAIGTVNAIRGVDLTVEMAGVVKDLRFLANQKVSEGDVIVQLDDVVQRADLDAARTQAQLDRQTLERAAELQKRGAGTTVALQAAEAAEANSSAQVAKLEAVLQQKQLRAPFGGTLGLIRVDEGQYITPGTVVASLQDLDTMRADFTIPEQQLPQLRVGQPVSLTLDNRDEVYRGEVIGIDSKVDPASRLVLVRAAIENPNASITPGQFARIKVELPTEDSVVALPQTAVVTSLYGDYVYVVRKKEPAEGQPAEQESAENSEAAGQLEARQVFVKVGRRSGGLVEVTDGVKAGDVIVTAGQNRLSTGTPVVIDNTINPAGGDASQAAAQ
ncbi:efflux RND transporter periplasmic adaptor subunit [Aquamicrobium sp. LC103]|uniref:efflux RND transporter periplasmic adaptor subunit n=1 Tax=Aquamicrobium sp. LC103 TaxID=1120658 RepID=UPI00063EC462|nr:efflux RND transporter periplasmic adaptor subunit [Aquamicrobium sp. LC103]TKT83008.1 efflux RND transporter periplasmic adaptor subunit [Aquamicrobium sp. LC103]